MAAASANDFEYVTQHFGFTPKAFVDGVYNAVNDYIKGFFKELGKVLDEEFAKGDANLSSKIRQECKKLIAKCYESVDKNMDKMETYLLKNIFVIPAGVLLPEDEVHKEFSDKKKDEISLTEAGLDNEIMELKTEILKEIRYRELVQCEHEKLRKILAELKRSHADAVYSLALLFIVIILTPPDCFPFEFCVANGRGGA
jgi:DNA mismatch repair ATPase MutS